MEYKISHFAGWLALLKRRHLKPIKVLDSKTKSQNINNKNNNKTTNLIKPLKRLRMKAKTQTFSVLTSSSTDRLVSLKMNWMHRMTIWMLRGDKKTRNDFFLNNFTPNRK